MSDFKAKNAPFQLALCPDPLNVNVFNRHHTSYAVNMQIELEAMKI